MNSNLDKIALDLYQLLDARFPKMEIGDENAEVLSKKTDIPKARFFDFDYKSEGVTLANISITLDEDDGVLVEISGDLGEGRHPMILKFIRGLRSFAKDHLLSFSIENTGKDKLDKRDYHFKAKRKDEQMEPIMENKMYGTVKLSYQDLGEARLVVKHSQPVNQDLAAGRTMHIDSIYIENSQGERFRYPYKHLNGARALAEHIKVGGNPYDAIGKHITSLSEELAQLRKFKNYVNRNNTLSEAMNDINGRVSDRIDVIKKEVHSLQRPTYYNQFAESFKAYDEQIIPEEVMNDWIDRLTIRTFNEELKSVFPYIYRLVDESEIPVKELSPDEMLSELSKDTIRSYFDKAGDSIHKSRTRQNRAATMAYQGDDTATKYANDTIDSEQKNIDKRSAGRKTARIKYREKKAQDDQPESVQTEDRTEEKDQQGKVTRWKEETPWKKSTTKDPRGKAPNLSDKARRETEKMTKEEIQFTQFMNSLVEDNDSDEYGQGVFDENPEVKQHAVEKLNSIFGDDLTSGVAGANLNIIKQLIPSPDVAEKIDFLKNQLQDSDEKINSLMKIELIQLAKHNEKLADVLDAGLIMFDGKGEEPVGGQEGEAPPAAAPAGEAPPPPAGEAPPMPGAAPAGEAPPPAPPVQESAAKAKMIKAIHRAKDSGATLDHVLDFGHSTKTLAEVIESCGMEPREFGFERSPQHGFDSKIFNAMKALASGFFNREAGNFNIGPHRVIIKATKEFPDHFDESGNPATETSSKFAHWVNSIDPLHKAQRSHDELSRIKQLSGSRHHEMDEGPQDNTDFEEFVKNHPEFDINDFVKNYPDSKISQGYSANSNSSAQMGLDQILKQHPELAKIKDIVKNPQAGFSNMAKSVPNQNIDFPGGSMNPQDMFKGILSKMPQGGQSGMPDFGAMLKNIPGMQESDELGQMLKIAGINRSSKD